MAIAARLAVAVGISFALAALLVALQSSTTLQSQDAPAAAAAVRGATDVWAWLDRLMQHRAAAAVIWGAVLLYWFYAMAFSCDEYFVPAVEVFCKRFHVPEDVAGATLLVWGSGSPELCTNFISIFVTKSPVGVGTIVGSEIFNMLVITGAGGLAALGGTLQIAWRPFMRDCLFYALSIAMLGWALWDGRVELHEAIALNGVYLVYVAVCLYFPTIAHTLCPKRSSYQKNQIGDVDFKELPAGEDDVEDASPAAACPPGSVSPSGGGSGTGLTPTAALPGANNVMLGYSLPPGMVPEESFPSAAGVPLLRPSASAVLSGEEMPNQAVGWLLVKHHRISEGRADRMCHCWAHYWCFVDLAHRELLYSDGPIHRRNHIAPAAAENTRTGIPLRRLFSDLGVYRGFSMSEDGTFLSTNARRRVVLGKVSLAGAKVILQSGLGVAAEDVEAMRPTDFGVIDARGHVITFRACSVMVKRKWILALRRAATAPPPRDGESDGSEPVAAVAEPEAARRSCLGWLLFTLEFPVKNALRFTVPDVREPEREGLYAVAFLASMAWLAVFSFLMVTSAENFADALRIPKELVGLTVTAAGTSFPNVVAAVIVAKRGLGPMAVANAFGSNIFNIFCALGVPWLFAAYATPGGYVLEAANIFSTIVFLGASLVAMVVVLILNRMRVGRQLSMALIATYCGYVGFLIYQSVVAS